MQYTYIYRLYKEGTLKKSPLLLKGLILSLVGFFLWHTCTSKVIPAMHTADVTFSFNTLTNVYVFTVLLFLPANWFLEAWKWHTLVKKTEPLSVWASFKGILTGITLGFVTPHGIGDYVGRIFLLKGPERSQCFGYVLLTKMTQLWVTLLLGGISIIYVLWRSGIDHYLVTLTGLFIILSNLLFLLLFFNNKKLINLFKGIPVFRFFYQWISLIKKVSAREVAYILGVSMVRYVVFSVQFLLLFYFFEVNLSLQELTMGIFFIFLAKSVFPTFFELGVREAAALFYFSTFPQPQLVLSACISLWLINIVLPALAGFFLLPKIKIFVS